MGILLIAPGLSEPSTLWMRRQLEMISSDISYLATDVSDAITEYEKYKIIRLRSGRGWLFSKISHYLNLLFLLRAVHSKSTDLVFIHYATTAVTYKKILQTTSKPVVIHCHGYDVTWDDESSGVPRHGKSYISQIRSMPDNFTFVGNSKRTNQRLVDIGISADRIALKYLGTKVEEVYPGRCLNTEALTVLYLGRLVDFKGPTLVIQAFEKACADGFKGSLVMAGDGPLRETCELLRERSPFRACISILGSVDAEMGKTLRQSADIFTAHNCTGPLSGQEEAFGVTIIEAMADGIPIINANNGSIPELLENDVTAILLEPGDINGHAKALIRFQKEPEYRHKIAKNAWESVRDNFSLEKERRRLREILHLPFQRY